MTEGLFPASIFHTLKRGREGGNETNYAVACAVTAVIVEHIKRRVRNTYSTLYFLERTMCQGRRWGGADRTRRLMGRHF